MNRAESSGPAVRVTGNDLTESVLKGATIIGSDGNAIGSVSEVDGAGATGGVKIDPGNAFATVPTTSLDFTRTEEGLVEGHATWSLEQLIDMPLVRSNKD